jgi:hypothetical protein
MYRPPAGIKVNIPKYGFQRQALDRQAIPESEMDLAAYTLAIAR